MSVVIKHNQHIFSELHYQQKYLHHTDAHSRMV